MSAGKQIGIVAGGIAVLAIVFALVMPKGINNKDLTGSAANGVDSSAKKCVIGGCSKELCVEEGGNTVSTCVFNASYACYKTATCERQSDGACGWTQTPELQTCVESTKDIIGK